MSAAEYRRGLIQQSFSDYGFTPPEGVIDSLVSSLGSDNQVGITSTEVGSYIEAFNELQKAAANDPMQRLLIDEQNATAGAGTSADTYANELQDVYKQAPKLFGALTPDQIDQYLAPAKTAFDYGLGKVEGDAAARGLTGSSLEATAMAQVDKQFKEGVLNQGLSVGLTEQQNLAGILQNLYNSKIQQQNLLYGLQQGTAGQISQQGYQNAEFLAQLPLLLQARATQQNAMQPKKDSSFWSNIGGAVGSILMPMYGGSVGSLIGAAASGENTQGPAQSFYNEAQTFTPRSLLMGNRTGGSNVGVPAGLNWASQPGASSSGFNSTAAGNEVWGPSGAAMLMGG